MKDTLAQEASSSKTAMIINLGCPKNEVDAEEMLGVLAERGYTICTDGGSTDLVVVNTCGFIQSAKEEAIEAVLRAVERKRIGKCQRVIVTGCLSQRYGTDLAKELPEVDAFLGAGQMERIAEVADRVLSGAGSIFQVQPKPHHRWLDHVSRVRAGAPWSAYLKISEGCDHTCTFCAIPAMRGRHQSKPFERVIEEARWLCRQGVREINLIAQDSTQYGLDIYQRVMLPELLRRLSDIEEVHWLRLFYCYPSRMTDEVVEAIAGLPKVCAYIDMPLQHADDELLRRMRRAGSSESYRKLIEKLRAAIPDVALRTTFIVGFPGETAAQFQRLMDVVDEIRFDHVGVFEYSAEDGTYAASLPNTVSAHVKRLRRNELMKLQQGISLKKNQEWMGRTLEVLIEGSGGPLYLQRAKNNSWRRGRTFRDAPEVDGLTFVRNCDAEPGEMVTVKITGATAYDLIGEPV
ncbi:MAG: 30S ribosomal protein S12 methylthiotransferase RimO [Armatimonadetes bacterium]|nr:30S ribosomal protein S12 methylthiotransferase RimO [Armatimonadota bacterium]